MHHFGLHWCFIEQILLIGYLKLKAHKCTRFTSNDKFIYVTSAGLSLVALVISVTIPKRISCLNSIHRYLKMG